MKCEYCDGELEGMPERCPWCGEEVNQNAEEDEKENIENIDETNENEEKKENSFKNENNTKLIAICNAVDFKTEKIKEIKEGEFTFYCEECGEEHTIDGDLYVLKRIAEEIETESEIEEEKETGTEIESRKENSDPVLRLVLKGNESEFIEIPKKGGIIGRSGDYGSKFFNDRYLLTISRKHFKIKFEDGEWIIRHLGKNDTEVNGENLEHGTFRIIRNNDKLRLAKTIVFEVRIEDFRCT